MNESLDNESPYKEDLQPLIETLEKDQDWNKRFGAASKLFRLGKEKAVDPLIKALQNDPHPEIKRFVADLLGRLADPRAAWALLAALRQGLLEKNSVMIHHTKQALLNIKSEDLPGILKSTVEDDQEFFEMKLTAVQLLGKIADTKSVQQLIGIIKEPKTDGRIRAAAIEQLVYTGHLSALQLILELLNLTSNKAFQKVVLRAMVKTPFKNKSVVFRIGEALLTIMENEESLRERKDEEISNLAASAMTQLAKNIGMELKKFMDELIKIRLRQKKE